jgi:hypothetical protein
VDAESAKPRAARALRGRMRFGLFLGLAVLLGALAWLARSSARGPGPRTAAREAEAREAGELELLAPEVPPGESRGDSSGAEGERDPSTRGRSSATRAPKAEAAAAAVRGRVVVAETGDPVEAVLDLRLRTIDLLRSEDLRTRPDGSFVGQTLFRRSVLLALVRTEEGRELVDHEALFDPRAEGEWLVRVPERAWPTFAFGTVVDRRGEPLAGAAVRLVPLAAGLAPADGESGRDGFVHLRPLRAGRYRLHADGRWARAEPVELELRTGPNELGLLVVPEPEPGGDLVLTIESDSPGVPFCGFELTDMAAAGGRRQRFDSTLGHVTEGGKLRLAVSDLPAGRYALEVRALDGRGYEPASLRFSPPARLELRATGAGHAGYTFHARDASTGEELLGFTVLGRKGRTWRCQSAFREERIQSNVLIGSRSVALGEVHLEPGFDSWVVTMNGYRAAMGRFAGAGATIEVALEPGWSELYQFEDANGDAFAPPQLQRFLEPPVLEGVEVLADGVLAGTSDADGFVALSADKEPAEIEFRKPGWFPADQYRLDILRTVEMAQSP